MVDFTVWAPHAKSVQLMVNDFHRPLVMASEDGWWHAQADVQAGCRYAFSLDQGPPLPDPRSCSQPDGVHGFSEVVDQDAFEWTDKAWRGFDLHRSVIYELHIGTFTPDGTFDAAIEKLDYLVDLGIGAIEIMPVAEFSGNRGWGYDGVDLFAPHHAYGGPDGLKRLVDACHGRGLGVLMDVVYNHLGPDGNYLGQFGPYFSDRHQTPWGDGVNFDGADSACVREFFLQNVELWLEHYHCDGLRLDAIHAIFDESPNHIVAEVAERTHAIGKRRGFPAWLTAESNANDPQVVREPNDQQGWGADAQWSDDFHHALHALLTGERSTYYVDFGDINDLAKAIRDSYVFTGQYSEFFKEDRGKPTDGVTPDHFIVFAQNHDQVGNRACGERLSTLVDAALLDVAAGVTLLSPFIPLIFQGEEWGAKTPFLFFSDYSDPQLGKAVTEGRSREYAGLGFDKGEVPDPQSLATFEASKLDWSEQDGVENARLLEWYKTLIQLRKSRPDFTSSNRDAKVDDEVLIMTRSGYEVAANFGKAERTIDGLHVGPEGVHIHG